MSSTPSYQAATTRLLRAGVSPNLTSSEHSQSSRAPQTRFRGACGLPAASARNEQRSPSPRQHTGQFPATINIASGASWRLEAGSLGHGIMIIPRINKCLFSCCCCCCCGGGGDLLSDPITTTAEHSRPPSHRLCPSRASVEACSMVRHRDLRRRRRARRHETLLDSRSRETGRWVNDTRTTFQGFGRAASRARPFPY